MTTATPEILVSPESSESNTIDAASQLLKAKEIVKHNVAWSAGAGMLPIPGADFVAITAVQLKMVSELCDAYNIPFKQSLARPIILSLIGSLGAIVLAPFVATASLKLIPGIGLLLSGTALAGTSAAITYGIGQLFTDHFKNGGTLENFNLVAGTKVFKKKVKDTIHETAEKVETQTA